MRLSRAPAQHLTYCTNIHPGESLAELRAALAEHVVRVKAAVSPDAPFGVGLRVSGVAARELAVPGALAELRAWLDDHGMYVFTINGFPYGSFHRARVKERVYQPDWRSQARVEYTNQLGDALCALLPDAVSGSISTVPCAFKAAVVDRAELGLMGEHLLQSAAHLARIAEQHGREIALALEPEPGCVLETIEETRAFFERELRSERAVRRLAELAGLSSGTAAARLERQLGVCLDTCHAAVEFEDLAAARRALESAAIGVKKLQLSCGLRVPRLDAEARSALAAFTEDVYLHQTVERLDGASVALTRFDDLPDALARATPGQEPREWRVHFHVPIFMASYGALSSTQDFLCEVLRMHADQPWSEHLEIETYTWDVLPAALRAVPVTDAIVRELEFVLDQLACVRSRPAASPGAAQ